MSAVSKAIDNHGGRYKFAKDMQLGWATINRWYHNGAIDIDHCKKASQVLGVPARELNAEVAKVFA